MQTIRNIHMCVLFVLYKHLNFNGNIELFLIYCKFCPIEIIIRTVIVTNILASYQGHDRVEAPKLLLMTNVQFETRKLDLFFIQLFLQCTDIRFRYHEAAARLCHTQKSLLRLFFSIIVERVISSGASNFRNFQIL